MIFKAYRTKLIFYVLGITLIIGAFFFILFYYDLLLLNFLLLLLLIFVLVKMSNYVDRINTKLTNLFESIQYSDFSISFQDTVTGNGFDELFESLQTVIEKFKEERNKRIEHYNYMKTIVKHVKIGLIAFDINGEIKLMNPAFRKIFTIKKHKNIRNLEENYPELLAALKEIKPFDSKTVQINVNGELMNLALAATQFVLNQKKYKLISINDIKSELEKTEMEAWEKLISVMTHEIMNSITPISSLASTVKSTLKNAQYDKKNLSEEDIEDISLASKTIKRRSEGLLKFVQKYRQVTKIPQPEFKTIFVNDIFNEIVPIITNNNKFSNVNFESQITQKNLEIYGDANLLEQVIINLINNALEALKNIEYAELKLIGRYDKDNRVLVEVIDNGPGIPEDNMKKIFIPFYTTKKQGSGIGLSLSRQIMRAHNGRLIVNSIPNQETKFTMEF